MQKLNLTHDFFVLCIAGLSTIPLSKTLASTMDEDVFNLSLKELMNIEVLRACFCDAN